jgi:hypothetical protein
MSQQLSRTIGFLCPKCRQSVIVERSLFSLTAAPERIACPCGGSYLQLEYQEDRFLVEAPCVACGGRHLARCPSNAFLHRKAISFSCGKTGVDCCCVGEKQEVYKTVKRMEAAADQLEERGDQAGTFLNSLVTEEMLGELRDIAQRGGVRCTCGSREWSLKVRYSSIELSCARCNGSLRLPSATMDDLNDLCCRDELVLQGQES